MQDDVDQASLMRTGQSVGDAWALVPKAWEMSGFGSRRGFRVSVTLCDARLGVVGWCSVWSVPNGWRLPVQDQVSKPIFVRGASACLSILFRPRPWSRPCGSRVWIKGRWWCRCRRCPGWSPRGRGGDGRSAMVVAGAERIVSGDLVVWCKVVAVALAVVRRDRGAPGRAGPG
jgi:hypothetical protein